MKKKIIFAAIAAGLNVADVEMLPVPNPISNWDLATLELATLAQWQHLTRCLRGTGENVANVEMLPFPNPISNERSGE